MNLEKKVDILYSQSRRGDTKDRYNIKDVRYCEKHYPLGDCKSRATKNNLRKYVKARDTGYKKDFDTYCYENDLVDHRKHRNGVDYENSSDGQWRETWILIGLICLFEAIGGASELILPTIIILPLIQIFGGRRKVFSVIGILFVLWLIYRTAVVKGFL